MIQHVLLISCPDQPGLIHRVSGILLNHQVNITENGEYVDHRHSHFFMRTAFTGNIDPAVLKNELHQILPPIASVELRVQRPKQLVLLGTREPHCLGDLLLRHSSGELNANIAAVISQYTDLERLVGRFDIPFHHVPVLSDDRANHEAALLKVIQPYAPDYLVLAKYMRVLSSAWVANYDHRIINIHHSFLPAFVGKNPYLQAYQRGVKIIGATAHFVNDRLDEGPIITQSVIPVDHTHGPAEMALAGRDVERVVLARALKLILEDRVLLHGGRTLLFE